MIPSPGRRRNRPRQQALHPAEEPVIVVGGGIAGLATACLLAGDGHPVTVLERNERVGGRAGTWAPEGWVFDTGPSWYLMPETFDHFFAMLGTSTDRELELTRLDPAYRVYSTPGDDGPADPVDVITGDGPAERLFERLEPGSGPRLRRYLRSATRAYRAALAAFLYNRFSSVRDLTHPRVLAALPAVLPLLGRSLWSYAAARFRHPVLRQILGYPAVFLGASPFRAPALYHLMSHLDLRDGVRWPRGGFTGVVRALTRLAEREGVEIRTGCEVTAITSRAGRAESVTYLQAGREHTLRAPIIVSAADEHHTETELLAPEDRTYGNRRWSRQVSGPGAVLVLLGVRGQLPQLAHHTLFFTEDWRENFAAIFGPHARVPDPASIYVCRASATDDVAPPGHENLFVLVPVPPDPGIGRGGEDGAGDALVEQTADRVIQQIAEWAGIPDLAERIVLRRTIGPGDFEADYHAFRGSALGPAHTLGQSAFLRGRTVSRRVGGLYYAGSTTVPGVGVPMCLISAELVLKAVRGRGGPGPLPEPAPKGAPDEETVPTPGEPG